jgi:transposase
VPNGKLGLGLIASILVEKYLDGLPPHRQRDRCCRLGLDIAVSTLADQVKWCTDQLQPRRPPSPSKGSVEPVLPWASATCRAADRTR